LLQTFDTSLAGVPKTKFIWIIIVVFFHNISHLKLLSKYYK